MSKQQKGKLKISRKAIVSTSIVVGVAVLALGIGLITNWLITGNGPGSNGSSTQGGVIGLPSNPLPRAVVDAQTLEAQGKYDQAQQSITSAIANTTDATEKYDLYLEQGVTFENQQKYTDAIAAYEHANTAKPTAGAYDAIGRVAEMTGDKQLAIDSYTKEIALLTQTDERTAAMKQDLQTKIKGLQS